jgi:hypothetical protein
MSSVLFLFLSHLGLGVAGTLLLVPAVVGVKFFRFNAGLGSVLLLIALAFRPVAAPSSSLATVGLVALVLATGALLFYWATIGRTLIRLRPVLLWITVAGGGVALVAQAVGMSAIEMGPSAFLTAASFFSSVALLGSACTAMILGHWYLVLPSMDVSFLQSIVKFHIVSTLVRTVVVGVSIGVALASWESPSGAGYDRYILSIDGVFLWQRVLFGLGAPALLSYLTWETAKIRSTQSATGILYVDIFAVIVGEMLAKYLLVATRVPV